MEEPVLSVAKDWKARLPPSFRSSTLPAKSVNTFYRQFETCPNLIEGFASQKRQRFPNLKVSTWIYIARRGLLHTVVVAAEQNNVPESYLHENAEPLRVLKAKTVDDAIKQLKNSPWLEGRYLKAIREKYHRWQEQFTPLEGWTDQISLDPTIPPEFSELRLLGTGPDQRIERIHLNNLFEALEKHPAFVLLGEPGSGKTTALQRLALDRAQACWDGNPDARLPILLPLGKWHGGVEHAASLFNLLVTQFLETLPPSDSAGQETLLRQVTDRLQRRLHQGKLLILFDALNEMPRGIGLDPSEGFKPSEGWLYREKVRRLAAFARAAVEVGNQVIFTCRPLDYDEGLALPRVEIEPLSDERIVQFVRKYLGSDGEALVREPQMGEGEAPRWIGAGSAEPKPESLWKLAKNPYMLRMVCFVWSQSKQLPRNRGVLFQRFVAALLRREWDKNPQHWIDRFGDLDTFRAAYSQALASLGFAITEEHGKGTTVETSWAKEKLPSRIEVRQEWIDFRRIDPGNWAINLLLTATGASLLDVPQNRETVRFWHQLLQEYFAALELGGRFKAGEDLTRYWRKFWWEREMPPFVRTRANEWETLPPPPPTGWEEATILLAGIIEPDASALLNRLASINAVLAGRCIVEGQAAVGVDTKNAVVNALVAAVSDEQVARRVRIAAGDALGFLGDPRIGDDKMVPIPAGEFTMGTSERQINELLRQFPDWRREWFAGEGPQHRVYLDAYWMDKYPVTNAQYQRFIDAGGYNPEEDWWYNEGQAYICRERITEPRYWRDSRFNKPNYPVVGVSYYEAEAYTKWAGKRLPTEAEWEKAARGTDRRIWPWGNKWDKSKLNCLEAGVRSTTPVGIYPSGTSPYGCYDMVGNAWEWCADWYNENYYRMSPTHSPQGPEIGNRRVLRGGSWDVIGDGVRVAGRTGLNPDYRFNDWGFRGSSPRVPRSFLS